MDQKRLPSTGGIKPALRIKQEEKDKQRAKTHTKARELRGAATGTEMEMQSCCRRLLKDLK